MIGCISGIGVSEVLVWTPARLDRELVDCPGTMDTAHPHVAALTEKALQRATTVIAFFFPVERGWNDSLQTMLLNSQYLRKSIQRPHQFSLILVALRERAESMGPFHSRDDARYKLFYIEKIAKKHLSYRSDMKKSLHNANVLKRLPNISSQDITKYCDEAVGVYSVYPLMWSSLVSCFTAAGLKHLSSNDEARAAYHRLHGTDRAPAMVLKDMTGMEELINRLYGKPFEEDDEKLRDIIRARDMVERAMDKSGKLHGVDHGIAEINSQLKSGFRSLVQNIVDSYVQPTLQYRLGHPLPCRNSACAPQFGSSDRSKINARFFQRFNKECVDLLAILEHDICDWFENERSTATSSPIKLRAWMKENFHSNSEMPTYCKGLLNMGFENCMDTFIRSTWVRLNTDLKKILEEVLGSELVTKVQEEWGKHFHDWPTGLKEKAKLQVNKLCIAK